MSQRLASIVVVSPKNKSVKDNLPSNFSASGNDEMGRNDKRKSSALENENDEDVSVVGGTAGVSGNVGESSSSIQDWRQELRVEVRAAIAEVMAQKEHEAICPGPFEIDASEVLDNNAVADLVKKMSAENRSNKTAIRLAGITKEGNKQHFLDMVEIRENVEKAAEALKESIAVYSIFRILCKGIILIIVKMILINPGFGGDLPTGVAIIISYSF